LIVAAHLLWRVGYYDSWLPNTYYAKAGENWLWGIVFTVSFMLSSGWLPLIALATGPFLLRKKWAAYMYVIMLLMFIHNLRIGGDFIFTGRFLYPLLPLTYILVQELFRLASISISNLTGHPGRKFLLRAAQVMIFILFVLGALWGLRINKWAVRFSRELNMQNKLLAKCLTENTEPSDTIAVMAAGIIPYYCDRNMIDMIGLADRHIARFGITDKRCTIAHQKGDSEYVLDRRPEIILLAPPRRELMRMTYPLRLDVAANNQLHANPRFWEQYEMADFDCDMYPVGVFVRKNIQTDSP
jgi:arabinofuranosyltransferase